MITLPLNLARKMLGVDKLPQELMDRIHKVQSNYIKVDGAPLWMSRQIIALIVAQYQMEE